MAQTCRLGPDSTLFLDNPTGETIVTVTIASPGQQQQASSRLQTGRWTADPEIRLDGAGAATVEIRAEGGEFSLSIRGSSISTTARSASGNRAGAEPYQAAAPPFEPMTPLPPMAPLPPLQMDAGGMHLRMGDMEMRMGSKPTAASQRRFCTQCGEPVGQGDRFCASCGHQLEP